ncbi:hypothetical protein [Kitasatospora sp. NPDC094011]|uniref:hypothetical protein n=1 Tax=Kitasatospora sp. NPDC094011 TaxID=3364090 RepID=UPI00382E67E6
MKRVGQAVGAAGGVLAVLGLAFGMWPVGDECGSAFSPTSVTAECLTALSGRQVAAWQLVILGVAVLVAGVVLAWPEGGSASTAES